MSAGVSSPVETGAAHAAPNRLPVGGAAFWARGNRLHPRRAAFEFYPTPPEAVRALLSVEAFDGPIWEPACGDGAISKVLLAAGHQVVSTDITDHGFGEAGIDFLAQTRPRARHIITNPPYGRGLADRFVGRALLLTRQTGGSVAMLLNLNSLCHPSRHAKFIHTPPRAIYAIDDLVCFPNGRPSEATQHLREQRYCWVVWTHGYSGRPAFWWLAMEQFR